MTIIILSLIVLLFSIMIHEIAHGQVAYQLGDSTAKYAGRLTLNPLKHIDFFGTIILPLLLILIRSPFVIGWAKPVPINPYNFRDQKWGTVKVAIAGPSMNFLIAIFFGLLIRFLRTYLPDPLFIFFSIITVYNFLWGLFNLIPIPPFDGHWILFHFLPEKWHKVKIFLYQYGLFILVFFIFSGGLFLVSRGAILLYLLITGQPLPL